MCFKLYWKFARTSVWIDHMDEISAFLPPPFNLLHLAWGAIYLAWYCTVYQIFQLKHKIACRGKQQEKCAVNEIIARDRLEYTVLTLTLIERLLEGMIKEEHSALCGKEIKAGTRAHQQLKCFRQEVVNLKRKQICLLTSKK